MKKKWNCGQQSTLCKESVSYFKEYDVYRKLFRGFRQKYESYGTFSGTVVLKNLKTDEIEILEGFFQKNFHGQKSISVSASGFEKALQNSRFAALSPKEIMDAYFQEELTGKKEQKQEQEAKWKQVFIEAEQYSANSPAAEWISYIQTGEDGVSAFLMKVYREEKDMESVRTFLYLGIQIVTELPCRTNRTEYLAVFSAKITGNPHAFDDGTRGGQLLSYIIRWNAKKSGMSENPSEIFPALQRQKEYLNAGILRDDMSNYAMLCGIRAWRSNGEIHQGMEGFLNETDPVQVSLSVIADWRRVACPDRKLYIVENPSVYAILCREWRGKAACMCMNGQPRLSSVLLLDLLAEAGIVIFYSGDLDPEGLLIAQKVKQYYRGEFHYWHMSVSDYEQSVSALELSAKRLKMLERINDPELIEAVERIKEKKMAGYQENIWLAIAAEKLLLE